MRRASSAGWSSPSSGKKGVKGRIERHLALWRAKPDFLAYDIRDLPSRFAAAQRRRGLPILTWTVRSEADRARAAAHADQIIYETIDERGATAIVARIGARRRRASTPTDWDACAGGGNPFLEPRLPLRARGIGQRRRARPAGSRCRSRSTARTGGRRRCMPAYVKSHSQGEYVFDHSWAAAYERAGGAYYPKLQIAVPFTPVPGRRLLLRDPALAPALIAAAEAVVAQQRPVLGPRHLHRAGGGGAVRARRLADPRRPASSTGTTTAMPSFDDFLAALSSRKRKAIRKEREAALAGLEVEHVSGAAITERALGRLLAVSTRIPARANGAAPISPARFFSLLGERMADRVLLILAHARRPSRSPARST